MSSGTGPTPYLLLRRGAPVIALVTILMTLAAVLLSVRQESLYESSADVFVDTRNVGSSLADVGQSASDPGRVLETQAKVARVPQIIRPTLAKVPPPRDPELFISRSSVVADTKADIMTFSVTDPRPQAAARLANAYANAYTAFRRELDTGALQAAQAEVEDQLKSLRRDGNVRSSLYADLTDRYQELRTREVLLAGVARLGRPAQRAVKVQPHPVRNGILGAVLGLLVGVGAAFVREGLNTRVRTSADVQQHLGLPLLGRLREPPKSLRGRHELAMLTMPDAPEAEAFHLLATNIEFTNLDRGAKSIMVTSAHPAEGKSTTIANLAVTFARSGKRVVLVDLDLRRPVVHRFFGLDVRPGITGVALGHAWIEETLVRVPLDDASEEELEANENGRIGGSLEVLTAGALPPNASEFVRSQALSDVLRRMEQRADLVLIDAPAMLVVSDAINLTQKVDALIVLTRIPAVKRPVLQELRRVLENAPVAKIGFVATGEGDDGALMGSYGYGYGPDEKAPGAESRAVQARRRLLRSGR